MRKLFPFLSIPLGLFLGMMLSACGGGSEKNDTPTGNNDTKAMESIGKGEGKISIIAWAGYIERGETDKNYDWVTSFEKESGCKVAVKTAATSDEMVTLMNQGGFDIVTASGDASMRLIRGGMVQPININLIKDWGSVDSRLQNAAWHTVDGVHYGVPYQWGSNVLMYNTNVFKTAPTSWDVVFKEMVLPDGKSNKGRVQAFDGPIYIADAALYLKHHQPALGIQDPYELTQAQFDAAIALLKGQRVLVNKYWHDAMVQMDDFKTEGVVATGSWPFQVNGLIAAKATVGSVIPIEGATGWADTSMMHAKAPNPNCAYMWLNHSLNKKLQGDLAAWFGSVPAVPDACNNNALLGAEGCKTNGIQNFDKIHFWKTPDCPNGKCIPYSEWTKQYLAVMASKS